MKSPDISVIIPVYNAEQYLPACLDSVLKQSYTNFEIVCINDTSTDASFEILLSYADKDPRLSIINLPTNHGASYARNSGIDNAQGRYVFFLDADDTLPLDALGALLSNAKNSGSELTMGKLFWLRKENDALTDHIGIQNPKQSITTTIRDSTYLQSVPGSHCCNLYDKQFLDSKNIRYDNDLTYGEDQLFQTTAIVKARKVTLIDQIVYHYHHYHSDSMTRKAPDLNNLLDDIEYQRRIVDLFFNAGLMAAGRSILQRWSYPIREYWLQIPESLTVKEATILFSSFRKLISEFDIKPWNESTPSHHHHLLTLILDYKDHEAYRFLGTSEAKEGFKSA